MYPSPRRSGPRPNYALRRLVAATGVILVVLVVVNLFGRLGDDDQDVAAATTSTSAPAAPAVVAPPPCAEGEEPTIFAREQDWYRTIVDPTYALPDLYQPPDLVPASEANYSAEYRIRTLMVEDLNRMRNAILEAGIPEVALIAGYRSVEEQRDLFTRREAELGREAAVDGTARPGHSEHHLGTAIDVRPIGAADVDATFGETATGQWLEEHSWEYGFVLSYPAGVEDVTCYKYEPWHFRYVGPDLAGRVERSGLTLREYLWHWEVTGSEPGVSPAAVEPPPLPTTTLPAAEGEAPVTGGTTDDPGDTLGG